MNVPVCESNNPKLAGGAASDSVSFGGPSGHQFRVIARHTRFATIQWFVTDSFRVNKDGTSVIVRQEDDFTKAVDGL